jgi:DNA-binding CsgD family transcriptional regulator
VKPQRHGHVSRRGRGGRGGHEPRLRIRSREIRATELSAQGWSQNQIAVELHISQPAVSKILQRVEEAWRVERVTAIDRMRARHSMRLNHMVNEAMRAWEQSKADRTRKRQRKTQRNSGQGDATVAELVVENEHGDPRYLEQARKALADERKIWGLDAPEAIAVRVAPPERSFEHATDEQLQERIVQLVAVMGYTVVRKEPQELTALPAPRDGTNAADQPSSTHNDAIAAYQAKLERRARVSGIT